ncbi:MAG: hypothetical protein TEF_02295 [Rhizobiales bacterium NRL2]|jgi:hypothetical protein|nr:MAG: hypothetical protein TEF_02295 [Rhizobiales bacterium NRL2]
MIPKTLTARGGYGPHAAAPSNIAGTDGGWHPAWMAEEKEKPVWERIAELGFADAVEASISVIRICRAM